MISKINLEYLIPERDGLLESVVFVILWIKMPCDICRKSKVPAVELFAQLCQRNLNHKLINGQNAVSDLELCHVGAELERVCDFSIKLIFLCLWNVPATN